MTPLSNSPSNRRQFLNASARYVILGGLATYAVSQGLKAGRLVADPNCVKLYSCSDCVEFARCTKTKADDFRSRSERRFPLQVLGGKLPRTAIGRPR